jgi:hypothetical protein
LDFTANLEHIKKSDRRAREVEVQIQASDERHGMNGLFSQV